MILPGNQDKFLNKVLQLREDCAGTMNIRRDSSNILRQWRFTGNEAGNIAIYNRLELDINRKSSYLFSPSDLRFHIEFENKYPQNVLSMAEVGGVYLTKKIEAMDIDTKFSAAVKESLTYGSSIFKLMYGHDGLKARLVPIWNFGVYRESVNELHSQEVVAERMYMTKEELWRRISHLPDAASLFKRAIKYAKQSNDIPEAETNFVQIVLGGQSPLVGTTSSDVSGTGGTVDVSAREAVPQLTPQQIAELIEFYEITVVDDETGDYTTIQMAMPDIIITPRGKKHNLFLAGELPYIKVQANPVEGYFFGRSDMAGLLKLQRLLQERLDDIRKLMSLQYDRLLAFTGFSGMTDEMYDQFREAGFITNEMPGAKVEDLTPKLPAEAFADVKEILAMMDDVSGFHNILSGQGETGVRSATHAQSLMRTASPRLRDQAMLIERQCSEMGNKAFSVLRAKEAHMHWIDDNASEAAQFKLTDIPDDFRVVVDSHSSSPVYEEDQRQMVAFLLKAGIIDGESALDMLNVPMRDMLKARYQKMQAAKAKFAAEHPEALHKGRKK